MTIENITENQKKYTIEIYDYDAGKEKRMMYIYHFEGDELLFESLTHTGDVIEFKGLIRCSDELIHDVFDDTYWEDLNILEITNIKKKKSDE